VKSTFAATVHDMKIARKDLAFSLGVHEMYISYWGNQENENRHMPAYLVPELCSVLKDFAAWICWNILLVVPTPLSSFRIYSST
jgi:hypothetical protein